MSLYLNTPTILEIVGVITNILSIWWAVKQDVKTWIIALVNCVCLFILFYITGLYAEMLLQVYFFVISCISIFIWNNKTLPITYLNPFQKISIVCIIGLNTVLLAWGISYFNSISLSNLIIADSFITISSVIATILLKNKKIETWYLWAIIDGVSVILYFNKGLYYLSFQYFIFLILVFFGIYNWNKQKVL
jgi:nicotinamide mononucleotide transporter